MQCPHAAGHTSFTHLLASAAFSATITIADSTHFFPPSACLFLCNTTPFSVPHLKKRPATTTFAYVTHFYCAVRYLCPHIILTPIPIYLQKQGPETPMSKRSASSSPQSAKKAHTENPNSYASSATDTWIAVGNCATSMGIIAMAIKAYESALSHTPDSVEAMVGWSRQLRQSDINANETVGSQNAIQRLTALGEHFAEVTKSAAFFRELTECYLLVGLNEQAHQAIQQAVQRQPQDPALHLLLAQTLIRAGARAQAGAALAHSLLLLPLLLAAFSSEDIETARRAHAELAAIAAANGNIELLITELMATLLLPPPPLARTDEHIALWCALATAKERANRIPEALEACERAEIAVGPSPHILITHAYLLLLDKSPANAEAALALLSRVVAAEPQEVRAADYAPADADRALEMPGDFLPWYLLGKAYTHLDSPRAAYDSYQIALRRAKNLPITWLSVGKLYLELKQLPDALAAYSQALRLQMNENLPGTAAAWDGLSCVYERCDDQLGDAADASLRAAFCSRAIGDSKAADYFDDRAKRLQAAAEGKGPVPELVSPQGVPNYCVRDLVTLLPAERIAFVLGAHPKSAPANGPVPGQTPEQPPAAQLAPVFNGHPAPAAPAAAPRPAGEAALLPHPQQIPRPMPPQGFVQSPPPHDMPDQPLYALGSYPPHMMSVANGVMSPLGGPQVHRSPHAQPMMNEGYPMAGSPGYLYGQYIPVHGGMVTHMQPYAGGNWRR